MKYVWALLIMIVTGLAYGGLALFQSIINALVSALGLPSGDTYTLTSAALDSMPLWLWLLPGVIGGIAVLVVLKPNASSP